MKYGLTLEDYERLLLFPCEICGQKSEVIDHTIQGTFHAPLCNKCNSAIEFLERDPQRLRSAADYVERTRA